MYSRDFEPYVGQIGFFADTYKEFKMLISGLESNHELLIKDLLSRNPMLTSRRTTDGKSIPMVAAEKKCTTDLFKIIIANSKDTLEETNPDGESEKSVLIDYLENNNQEEFLEIVKNTSLVKFSPN